MIQQIINQNNYQDHAFEDEPNTSWGASDSGTYPDLGGVTKVTLVSPTTVNVNTYHHHPHIIEYEGEIHVIYSNNNTDEENPGQNVWYQKSSDFGLTWTTEVEIFESQDNPNNSYVTDGGRVIIPSHLAIVNGNLYALGDVNDRSSTNEANPRTRTKVGVLARQINSNATFGTVFWIENGDGSFNAPDPIPTYPSYTFNTTLRSELREAFITMPDKRPVWYYSVPSNDPLYTDIDSFDGGSLTEPSIVELPSGQWARIWRYVGARRNKYLQTSNYGTYWNDAYLSDIPDAPSVTEWIRLRNNSVGIVGNNFGTGGVTRSPLFFAVSDSGLTYSSDNIYQIDTELTGAVFPGFNKDTGVQYPDLIEMSNGQVCVVYSVNKEDIRVAIFDKPAIV